MRKTIKTLNYSWTNQLDILKCIIICILVGFALRTRATLNDNPVRFKVKSGDAPGILSLVGKSAEL